MSPAALAIATSGAPAPDVTAGLRERLSLTYSEPSWALLQEVRNAGGFEADRSCDAIAVGLWPSTGHKVVGFEIKVSRADWQREMKDPWKAEAFGRYCDEWWLVLASPDIVRPEELPRGWGVLVPRGRTLKRANQAIARAQVDPIPRELLAALMKRSCTAANDAANARYALGVQAGRSEAQRDISDATEKAERLKKQISDFEEASGIRISNRWEGARKVGEAVKFVMDGGLAGIRRDLARIDDFAANLRGRIADINLENPVFKEKGS